MNHPVEHDTISAVFEGECPACGCVGLHACMGSKPERMTDRERAMNRHGLRLCAQVITLTEENAGLRAKLAECERDTRIPLDIAASAGEKPIKSGRRNNHIEDDHCRWLTQWRNANERRIPELKRLYHWPQGGKRSAITGAILKAMGVRKGPWDYWLFVRRGECPGLMVEMKQGKNKLTPEQAELGEYMRSEGWQTATCYHWHEAAAAICSYLNVPRGF